MKNIILVTLFVGQVIFAKTAGLPHSAWPQVLTQNVNGKTLKEVCQGQSFCAEVSSSQMNDSALFKISELNGTDILLSYKNKFVNVGHKTNSSIFTVNQKPLDLKQLKNKSELIQAIQEKLPQDHHASNGFFWINFAEAQIPSPAQFEISIAIARLVTSSDENEICQQTLVIADKCDKFAGDMAAQLGKLTQIVPNVSTSLTDAMKLKKAELKSTYTVASMMELLNSQFNSISPNRKEAMERCECEGGLCKLAEKSEKPTALGQRFKQCENTAKLVRKQFPRSEELQTQLDKIDAFLEGQEDQAQRFEGSKNEKDFTKSSNGR